MFDDIHTAGPVKMWQPEKGVNVFRFQSSHPVAVRRMRQREGFALFGWQVNGPLRIFDTHLYDRKSAKRALLSIAAGLSVELDSDEKISSPARQKGQKVGHRSTAKAESETA
ncbi:MAG: hypothetical protein C4519_14860 [Desulfobacteraceae bacterium]|nr:MAG: hypothetical protein C4519_14860 [Desulfobacteraceae bacterium]